MTVINMTPRDINVFLPDGGVRAYPKSAFPIRIESTSRVIAEINGVPVTRMTFGEPVGLPPYDETGETYYLVSSIVQAALPERKDLLIPSDPVRNADGNIIGCKSFAVR
jgi:hypothetical protein